MGTIIAVGKQGRIEETFVVAEPYELAVKIINKRNAKLKTTQPTFGTDAWSYALELKSELALISENTSKGKDFDLFYDTERKCLVHI